MVSVPLLFPYHNKSTQYIFHYHCHIKCLWFVNVMELDTFIIGASEIYTNLC